MGSPCHHRGNTNLVFNIQRQVQQCATVVIWLINIHISALQQERNNIIWRCSRPMGQRRSSMTVSRIHIHLFALQERPQHPKVALKRRA
jgi:hypothetical protein